MKSMNKSASVNIYGMMSWDNLSDLGAHGYDLGGAGAVLPHSTVELDGRRHVPAAQHVVAQVVVLHSTQV